MHCKATIYRRMVIVFSIYSVLLMVKGMIWLKNVLVVGPALKWMLWASGEMLSIKNFIQEKTECTLLNQLNWLHNAERWSEWGINLGQGLMLDGNKIMWECSKIRKFEKLMQQLTKTSAFSVVPPQYYLLLMQQWPKLYSMINRMRVVVGQALVEIDSWENFHWVWLWLLS